MYYMKTKRKKNIITAICKKENRAGRGESDCRRPGNIFLKNVQNGTVKAEKRRDFLEKTGDFPAACGGARGDGSAAVPRRGRREAPARQDRDRDEDGR